MIRTVDSQQQRDCPLVVSLPRGEWRGMNSWDDDFREPTEDEISARRTLSLAIALINTRRPMTTTEVRRDFYPDLSDEAFRKAFRRDRTRLATAGMLVKGTKTPAGEPAWLVDEELSYARDNQLTPEDALVLDSLLLPLAADPSQPFSRDLRHALAKIDRSFDGSSAASLPASARVRNNSLTRIEEAMTRNHAIRMNYVRADGSHTTRVVVPYGLFPLRNTTYMVAARVKENGTLSGERPHTYNLERISNVREMTRETFETPTDFDVRDFRILPFQMGEVLYTGVFYVPEERIHDVRSHATSGQRWNTFNRGAELEAAVCDEDVAAAWAIAEGIRPLAPESLANAWKKRIATFQASQKNVTKPQVDTMSSPTSPEVDHGSEV